METSEQRELRLERQRAYTRKYVANNKDKAKAATKKWRLANRPQVNAAVRAWRAKNLLRSLVNEARNRAKRLGFEFTITHEDVPPMGTHCPLLGHPFPPPEVRDGVLSPSLDRKDNTKGYVPGNVWIVGRRANRIKNEGTAEEHETIARAMRAAGLL